MIHYQQDDPPKLHRTKPVPPSSRDGLPLLQDDLAVTIALDRMERFTIPMDQWKERRVGILRYGERCLDLGDAARAAFAFGMIQRLDEEHLTKATTPP